MDVSRIDAFNPNSYNWRNMTAREIIKHKDEGENVPPQYVQWAIDFINSIYSDDDTTYEVAISQNKTPLDTVKKDKNGQEIVEEAEENQKTDETAENKAEGEVGEEKPKLNIAQSFREEMKNQGIGLFEQAMILSGISKENQNNSLILRKFILPTLEDKSEKEIRQLAIGLNIMESQMNQKADRLKYIMAMTGHSDINDETQLQAAYALGEELNKMAIDGHESVTGGEYNLEDLGNQMIGCLQMFDATKDFGQETINAGNELKLSSEDIRLFFISISSIIIQNGKRALEEGLNGIVDEGETEEINNTNKETAAGFHQYLEDKTGIEDPEKNKDKKVDNTKDKKNNENKENKTETNTQNEDNVTGEKGQSRTEELKNDGADERTIAMTLREESKSKNDESLASMGMLGELVSASNEEYSDLNNDIKNLMNEIDEIRNEIISESTSAGSDTMGNNIARINQLNEEIRQYGGEAQTLAGSTEGIIDNYSSQIQDIGDIFSDAIAIGTEAINAGNGLIAESGMRFRAFRYVNEIIGKNAISTGSKTVKDGQNGMNEQSKANSVINSNLSGINNIQSDVQSKTGVGAIEGRNNEKTDNKKEQDINNKKAKEQEKKKESEKDIKTSQNDGTDTTDKLNISLDELVKRKVRRGEYAKEA